MTGLDAQFARMERDKQVRAGELVRIRVTDPLPLQVAGTLMELIGAAWPDAQVEMSNLDSLSMLIDPRPKPKRVSKKTATGLRTAQEEAAEGVPDARFHGFDADGKVRFAGLPEDVQRELGALVAFLLEEYGAANYLEWRLTLPGEGDVPDRTLVMTGCWSEEQTPHEVRKKIEAERDQLAALLREAVDGTRGDDFYERAARALGE